MDLLQLRYFKALAEEEHLSRTAETLMISQPALSITIKKLENELGVPLFDRKGRGIKLNENGKLFLMYIGTALDNIDTAKAALSRKALSRGDQLNVGLMSPYVWQDITCEFATLHPNIVLSQRSVEDRSYINLLENGDIDFFIGNVNADGSDKGKDNLDFVPFAEDELVLIVPEKSHLAQKKSVYMKEIRSEQFISRPPGQIFQLQTNKLCQDAGFTPKISMICDYTTREAMVASGGGLSFSSKMATRWLNQPGVKEIAIADKEARYSHYLIWNSKRKFTESMEIFKDFVISKHAGL